MEDFLNLPEVSFIVITHNFSKYAGNCLESIKNQTYKNFEIIIVDDASKDDTAVKIQKFINKNPQLKITFIKNNDNIGQLGSFIEGLKRTKGQFVCTIDGDDVLFPEYCAVHLETHLKTSVALTTCLQAEIDDNNVIHTFCSIDGPKKQENLSEIENKTFDEFLNYRKAKNIDMQNSSIKILDNDKYSFATWHWGPASSAMMRKSVCDLLLMLDKNCVKEITADKFIFSFCHLIGSSAVIYKTLYAYRRHDSNYSLANPVMGNKKYLKSKTQLNYLKNNKKIRSRMFKYIKSNDKFFREKFNKINMLLIYKRIIFSFDSRFFKGLVKALFTSN